jgi:hypothetical protein
MVGSSSQVRSKGWSARAARIAADLAVNDFVTVTRQAGEIMLAADDVGAARGYAETRVADIVEAARLDGLAGPKMFRYITVRTGASFTSSADSGIWTSKR